MSVFEIDFFSRNSPGSWAGDDYTWGSTIFSLTDEDVIKFDVHWRFNAISGAELIIPRWKIDKAVLVDGNIVRLRIPLIANLIGGTTTASPNYYQMAFIIEEALVELINEDNSDELILTMPSAPRGMLRRARLRADWFAPVPPASDARGSATEELVWFWQNQAAGGISARMIEEGQSMPAAPLAHVMFDWTRDDDSDSVAWEVYPEDYEVPIGTDVGTGVQALADSGEFVLVEHPTLLLQAFQTYGADLTGTDFGTGVVRVTNENILTDADRRMHGFGGWTHVIIKNKDGLFPTPIVTPEYTSGPGHYGYIEIPETNAPALISKIANTTLRNQRRGLDALTVEIKPGESVEDEDNGRYLPWVHFKPGDEVTVQIETESPADDHGYDNVDMTVVGVKLEFGTSDDTDEHTQARSIHIVLELNAGTEDDGRMVTPTGGRAGSDGLDDRDNGTQPGASSPAPSAGTSGIALARTGDLTEALKQSGIRASRYDHRHIVRSLSAPDANFDMSDGIFVGTMVAVVDALDEPTVLEELYLCISQVVSTAVWVQIWPSGGSGTLTVEEDGDTPITGVDHIVFDGLDVTDDTGGQVTVAPSAQIADIIFIIDGGGSAIATGIKGDVQIDFACTIQSVTLLADQSGSIVIDIWKDTYANYPPVDGDSITASAVPTISSATKSTDSTLTGWTTAIAAGNVLRFNVDSASTITRVSLILKVVRT